MHWILKICLHLSLISLVNGVQCNKIITLHPKRMKPMFEQWINTTTKLICPAGGSNISAWYSPRTVYNMTIGYQSQAIHELVLPWFPDVPQITALFRTHSAGVQTKCLFTLFGGILKAELFEEIPLVYPGDVISFSIYRKGYHTMTNEFHVCKDLHIRNITCRRQINNGTYLSIDQQFKLNDLSYILTEKVVTVDCMKYECYANVASKFMLISVRFKDDIDECIEAEKRGKRLCETSKCIDYWPGYRCPDDDYIETDLCKGTPDWFCQNKASYKHIKPSDKCAASNPCLEAANLGVLLCDAGYYDCEQHESGGSFRCRRGVPLLDVCHSISNRASNWSCPQIKPQSLDLQKFRGNIVRIAHNIKTLYTVDPDSADYLLDNLTNEQVEAGLNALSELARDALGMNLIHTMSAIINPRRSWIASRIEPVEQPVEIHDETPTKKLGAITKMFHMFASIVRSTASIRRRLQSGEADTASLKFWEHDGDTKTVTMNDSNGNVVSLRYITNATEADIVGALLPSQQLQSSQPADLLDRRVTTGHQVGDEPMLDSDVVLIDSLSANSTYSVTVKKLQPSANYPICQQLLAEQRIWSSEHCITVVKGSTHECRCSPQTTGTFAMALVYWLGDAKLPVEQLYVVNVVNYVFAPVTIIALFLFLIFTRFIGVFRLDQFNIAFCLMLSAIVTLPVPHVSDSQPISCTIVAVSACFFPLAAFSWKLIFGVNTLILIAAPHSRYHDQVSRQRHCFPLVWIGYFIPAVIIGAWFGYTGKVHKQHLCIGPAKLRWLFVGPITAVVLFNFVILIIVGIVLLRSFLLTRKSRLNRGTHFLVLAQLMLTLGIPYVAIYIQLLDPFSMLVTAPVAMALTAVFMFMLVAVIDEENRLLMCSFLRTHLTRTSLTSIGQFSLGLTRKTSSTHDRKCVSASLPGDRNGNVSEAIGSFKEFDSTFISGDSHPYKPTNEMTFEPGWLYRYSSSGEKYKQCPLVDPEDVEPSPCTPLEQKNGHQPGISSNNRSIETDRVSKRPAHVSKL